MIICYLFFNWLYKCAAKTMLCLTKNEVYKEAYAPFKRSETSIPINKIIGVTTYNVFWIFRTLIIHQYGKLPLVFFTWNNQEFKDKLNELITTDEDKIENEYEDKNIISKSQYKYLKYLAIVLVIIICLIGIVRFFSYISSPERKIPGTYSYNNNEIILNEDGSCNIDAIEDDVTDCDWSYNDYNKQIQVNYDYEYYY